MKTKAFLVAMVGILLAYAPVMAGNFYVGKIPAPGSGDRFLLQSNKVWIGNWCSLVRVVFGSSLSDSNATNEICPVQYFCPCGR